MFLASSSQVGRRVMPMIMSGVWKTTRRHPTLHNSTALVVRLSSYLFSRPLSFTSVFVRWHPPEPVRQLEVQPPPDVLLFDIGDMTNFPPFWSPVLPTKCLHTADQQHSVKQISGSHFGAWSEPFYLRRVHPTLHSLLCISLSVIATNQVSPRLCKLVTSGVEPGDLSTNFAIMAVDLRVVLVVAAVWNLIYSKSQGHAKFSPRSHR